MWLYFRHLIGRPLDERDLRSYGFRVEFDVDRTFKGSPARRAKVFTGRGGGDCGYEFEVGRQYLVYAYCEAGGMCPTSICSGTSEIENATEALRDLESR